MMRPPRLHLFSILLILILIPNPVRAVDSCAEYEREMRTDLLDECEDADLTDPNDEDYCTRINLGTEEALCEFTSSRNCTYRPGASVFLCERARANNECTGACPAGGLFGNAPAPSEAEAVAEQVILPRLQIDVPGLQPFTKPRPTQEGEQIFLNIGFIGQYIVGLYKYLVGIVGILVGAMYTWAGLKWITSGGSPEKIGDAKKKIAGATMGLVLTLGAYLVLYLVNPELTVFKPLAIRYVEREALVIENFSLPDPSGDSPAGTFDSLFQQYANCAGIDWRALRMIAQKESGLRPAYVNQAGFIGLFQSKPQYCGLPAQFRDRCTPQGLSTPAINIAGGALKMKKALRLIDKYCSQGDPKVQFTIVYGANSTGAGGMESALKYAQAHGGCTADNVRQGLIEFWKNYKSRTCGGTCTDWFIRYYGQTRCSSYTDPRDCMGGEKYNYTLRAAEAYVAQGGGAVRVEPTGPCPLDTDNPFPSS